MDLEGSSLQANGGCGGCADADAVVVARGCRGSQNHGEGYRASDMAKLTETGRFSDGDKSAYQALECGELNMEEVTV